MMVRMLGNGHVCGCLWCCGCAEECIKASRLGDEGLEEREPTALLEDAG